MINRILMELYDEYEKENIEPLKEFSNITFINENAYIVFMGCTLIMFSKVHGLKPRYLCTREELLEIVLSIKKKINKLYFRDLMALKYFFRLQAKNNTLRP